MNKQHPLAEEIKRFVDAPDKWQWYRPSIGSHVTFDEAMKAHAFGAKVELVPKPSMIPSHLLPEGWKVERLRDGYRWHDGSGPSGITTKGNAMWQLLNHIDPETNTDAD